jgi:hypothetical protein
MSIKKVHTIYYLVRVTGGGLGGYKWCHGQGLSPNCRSYRAVALKPLSDEDEYYLYVVLYIYLKYLFLHIRTDANVLLPRPSWQLTTIGVFEELRNTTSMSSLRSE